MPEDVVHKLEVAMAELRKDMLYAIERIEQLENVNAWILRVIIGAVVAAVMGLVLTH